MANVAKSSLSEPRRWLVELMRRLGFGRIEGLVVRDGQPVFVPRPSVVRDVKLGGDEGCPPHAAGGDFLLKKQVIELFQYFDRIGSGTIRLLEIRHGLPFRILLDDLAA